MEELSYLKIPPREQEENRLLLLKGERLYEESTGDDRVRLDHWLREFEDALRTRDAGMIEDARRKLREHFKEMEEQDNE